MKSGSRFHVNPGARILWIVTMKLIPVRILAKPATKTASVIGSTAVFVVSEYGV